MTRTRFIGGLAVLVLGCFVSSHRLFADKPQKASKATAIRQQPMSRPAPLGQQFPLNVAIDSSLPEQIRAGYQKINAHLNAAEIPTSTVRNEYFRVHANTNSPQVIGWNAVLMNVEETPQGFLAKLRVYAYRKGVIDSLYYYEYYLINNTGAHFIQWEHEPVQPRDVIGI